MILGGDLNVAHKEIDIYDPKGKEKVPGFSPQERKSFDDFLNDSGFVDTFRNLYPDQVKYSFWSVRASLRESNRGWRLDYFLGSKDAMPLIEDSLIHNDYWGSDHCPVELKLKLEDKDDAKAEEKVEKDDSKEEEKEGS